MSHRPWYRRFPDNFIVQAAELSLEEKGALSVFVDLIYATGGPVEDHPQQVARLLGCSTFRWKQIRERLLKLERLALVAGGIDAPIVHRWANWTGRETIPAHVRRAVFERDGDRCAYCGATDGPFHLDHVFPAIRGGHSGADNLVVACAPCNLSKGAQTPEEWLQ